MYRSCRGDRRESEYTHTTAGVDPQVLDQPLESSGTIAGNIALSPKPTDWTKYYEQTDPGTSTDILDTDKARQTTSLILQQASTMAAEGSDETPLIFATQMAATIADLDIEGLNPDELSAPTMSVLIHQQVVLLEHLCHISGGIQTMIGTSTISSMHLVYQVTHSIVSDTRVMVPTVPFCHGRSL